MLQILNPFKAKTEFQKLKSKKIWILALVLVLIPVLLSTVGNMLIQQERQDVIQQLAEERDAETRERTGQRGPMGGVFRGLFQGAGGASTTMMMVIGLFIGIISAIVFWIVKSVVFHAGAQVLGGEGALSSTIHVMAYTYIPFIFKGILDVIKGITYEAPTSMEELMAQTRNTDMVLNFIKNHFTIFMLWALFLMIVAVKTQYNLSNKKAVMVVLIPYIIVWVLQVFVLPGIFSGGFFLGGM
jgi:hypothetical protein